MEQNISCLEFNLSDVADVADVAVRHSWKKDFRSFIPVYAVILQVLLQLSVGCNVSWPDIMKHIKKPLPLLVGMICQFVLLPLTMYVIVLVAQINNIHAAGFIVLASCPGGAISNTVTYLINGDLSLSITMTFIATTLSNVMLPANLWLYGRQFESRNFAIPYKNIAISLLMIIVPLAVGMILKWKYSKLTRWVIKAGSFIGVAMITVYTLIEAVFFPEVYVNLPSNVLIVAVVVPPIVIHLSYCVASLFHLNTPLRKAISIECGSQNISLSIAIFALSFPVEVNMKFLGIPVIYGFGFLAAFGAISAYGCLIKMFKWFDLQVDTDSEDDSIEEANTKFFNNHNSINNHNHNLV